MSDEIKKFFLKVYQQGDATLVSTQEQSLQQSGLCS